MHSFPPQGLFVTGTNTEVGKTYVASQLARWFRERGVRVGVYKPAASGGRLRDGLCESEDAVHLWQAAGCPGTLDAVCPQRFLAPLVPHLAARAEGREIDPHLLLSGAARWFGACDLLIVEGAGGYLSPLTDSLSVAEIALQLQYPLLIVAANQLGTIHLVRQTLFVAQYYGGGVPLAGVVLNDPHPAPPDISCQTNPRELQRWCGSAWLTHLRWNQAHWPPQLDWQQVLLNARRRPATMPGAVHTPMARPGWPPPAPGL